MVPARKSWATRGRWSPKWSPVNNL